MLRESVVRVSESPVVEVLGTENAGHDLTIDRQPKSDLNIGCQNPTVPFANAVNPRRCKMFIKLHQQGHTAGAVKLSCSQYLMPALLSNRRTSAKRSEEVDCDSHSRVCLHTNVQSTVDCLRQAFTVTPT